MNFHTNFSPIPRSCPRNPILTADTTVYITNYTKSNSRETMTFTQKNGAHIDYKPLLLLTPMSRFTKERNFISKKKNEAWSTFVKIRWGSLVITLWRHQHVRFLMCDWKCRAGLAPSSLDLEEKPLFSVYPCMSCNKTSLNSLKVLEIKSEKSARMQNAWNHSTHTTYHTLPYMTSFPYLSHWYKVQCLSSPIWKFKLQ